MRGLKVRYVLVAVGVGGVALAALLGLLLARQQRPVSDAPASAPAEDDPRVTFASPYRNVRPGVAYSGDDACRECHAAVCTTYEKHPMGRSLARVGAGGTAGGERFGPDAHAEFEKFGFHYRAEARDGQLFHAEEGRDRSGAVATRLAEPMAYAIGSGAHARSYLFERQGFVFQSPLTWYSQAGRWDGSPGYGRDWHFNRPAPPDCLFCHANAVEPVAGTVNRYAPPLFRGLTIGCERCHGPGSLHVARRQTGADEAEDDTIVNPARLEPALREAVCQQCHLAGRVRVLKEGRGLMDYRPGLPLHLFWSVFDLPTDLGGDVGRVAGHTEQMHSSRCYRASKGALGCVSCHDPHRKPEAADAPGVFRAACLKCHAEQACRARADRLATQPPDHCASCHLPKSPTPGIGHVALSDHRVRRRPADVPAAGAGVVLAGRDSLVLFHRDQIPADDPGAERDLGVALVTLARSRAADPRKLRATQGHFGEAALPLLTRAVALRSGDVAARDALANALWHLGRQSEAVAELRAVLDLAPDREYTLLAAMWLADELGRKGAALEYAERAAAVDPVSLEALAYLGRARGEAGDWAGTVTATTAALALDPTDAGLRSVRIQALLRTGRPDDARADYELLARVVPDAGALRRWYTAEGGVP